MALTGLNPDSGTPGDYREFFLGASESGLGGKDRTVLILGNRTVGGTETLDVLDATAPILDDIDAKTRFGERSEWYAGYRRYVAVDPGATIYGVAVTESAGTAASCKFVLLGAADAVATGEFTIHGEKVFITVADGDALTVILDEMTARINAADEGRLQVVATEDGITTLTLTCAQLGPRGDEIIGADATHGIRFRWLHTVATTVTKGNVVAGATADDGSAALLSAADYESFYWALPWTARTAVSATDNQIGEAVNTIKTQCLPINGKEQVCFAGLRGTQAECTAVAISAGANSAYCSFIHAENNDWTPMMLAAHYTAVKRSKEIAHPSAKVSGYTSTDNTIWQVPAPFLVADRASKTEVDADIDNGVSPVGTRPSGNTYLVRDITSRSRNANGDIDHRVRSGHIFSATAFAWQLFLSRYSAQKQDFVDDDPAEGEMPTKNTTTPSSGKAVMIGVIDDLTSSNPMGKYNGPILSPSKKQKMKDSMVATKVTAGINFSAELFAVEHNLKSATELYEVSPAY